MLYIYIYILSKGHAEGPGAHKMFLSCFLWLVGRCLPLSLSLSPLSLSLSMHTYAIIYVHICACTCVYMYILSERERERERDTLLFLLRVDVVIVGTMPRFPRRDIDVALCPGLSGLGADVCFSVNDCRYGQFAD